MESQSRARGKAEIEATPSSCVDRLRDATAFMARGACGEHGGRW